MLKALKLAFLVASLVALTGAASAAGFEKGSGLFALQLTEGVADLATASAGYISAYDHSEVGAQAQYWYFFQEDYALTLSGGIGFFSETNEPGTDAAEGALGGKYTQSSWQARLGGDRVVKVNDRFHLFVGPGIQVWSGRGKFENIGGSYTYESPDVMRIALEGRIGVHMAWSDNAGAFCQLGHYIGRASAEENGAKATWWPSGNEGAFGFAFRF